MRLAGLRGRCARRAASDADDRRPACPHRDPPENAYFKRLTDQLEQVERDLESNPRATIVSSDAELKAAHKAGKIAFVHGPSWRSPVGLARKSCSRVPATADPKVLPWTRSADSMEAAICRPASERTAASRQPRG